MGALSELLNGNITEQTDKDAMAADAGITRSTLDQILAGSIECPPQERISAMAAYVGVSVGALEAAGERDGCNYEQVVEARRQQRLGDLYS